MLGRKYFFKRPSFSESRAKRAMCNTEPASPLAQAVSFSVISQHSCLTGVLGLLHLCCPAAVFCPAIFNTLLAMTARIVAVPVNAVNACGRKRLQTHIFQKVSKLMEPSLADSHAFAAIEVIIRVVVFIAAPLRLCPRCVFRSPFATTTCSSRPLAMASARNCTLLAKIGTGNNGSVSALTATQPVGKFATDSDIRLYSQFAVWISSLVFDTCWKLDRIIRRHDSTPSKLDCVRAKAVNHDRFGSFHCIRQGRLVQHVA